MGNRSGDYKGISLTPRKGSSRNFNLVSITSSKQETTLGFLPTWRPLLTGLLSDMEAGKSGNLSRASTKLERLPLRASLQCEHLHLSWHLTLADSSPPQSRALGHTQDLDIAKETLDYMWTKAKDQDFHYFFSGLSINNKTRRLLRSYLFENYDKVRQ